VARGRGRPGRHAGAHRGSARPVSKSTASPATRPTARAWGNVFPPLAGSDYLLSEPERAITWCCRACPDRSEVNGQKFDAGMPHLNYLTRRPGLPRFSATCSIPGATRGGYIMPEQVAARRRCWPTPEGVKGRPAPGRGYLAPPVRRRGQRRIGESGRLPQAGLHPGPAEVTMPGGRVRPSTTKIFFERLARAATACSARAPRQAADRGHHPREEG